MAERVPIIRWVTSGYEETQSLYGYETFEVQAVQKDMGSPFRDNQTITPLHLFVHEPTGIVVQDVAKFEEWLSVNIRP